MWVYVPLISIINPLRMFYHKNIESKSVPMRIWNWKWSRDIDEWNLLLFVHDFFIDRFLSSINIWFPIWSIYVFLNVSRLFCIILYIAFCLVVDGHKEEITQYNDRCNVTCHAENDNIFRAFETEYPWAKFMFSDVCNIDL